MLDKIGDGITQVYGPNRMWDYHVQYVGCIDIQAGGKSENIANTMRLEWNPDKDGDQERHLRSWIGLVKAVKWELGRVHVTRLDWACDYGDNLQAWRWVRDGAQSWVAYGGPGGMETLYLGSASSDRQIRVYNKQLEMTTKQGEFAMGPWWRVEAETRGAWAIDGAKGPKDPFAGVRECEPLAGSDWDMINPSWLERYGLVAVKGEVRPKVGRNAWCRHWAKKLRDSGRVTPSEVYAKLGPGLWKSWATRIAGFADEARYDVGGASAV
jgi:hypothetical protein